MEPKAELLRVALPRACNTQQAPHNHATTGATVTQQASLKALAREVLECRNTRNNRATSYSRTAQQRTASDPLIVAQDETLQAFSDLVRTNGAINHHVLLHRQEIESQLDAGDIQELLTSDRAYRQEWAELLAYRLCMSRLYSK